MVAGLDHRILSCVRTFIRPPAHGVLTNHSTVIVWMRTETDTRDGSNKKNADKVEDQELRRSGDEAKVVVKQAFCA